MILYNLYNDDEKKNFWNKFVLKAVRGTKFLDRIVKIYQ